MYIAYNKLLGPWCGRAFSPEPKSRGMRRQAESDASKGKPGERKGRSCPEGGREGKKGKKQTFDQMEHLLRLRLRSRGRGREQQCHIVQGYSECLEITATAVSSCHTAPGPVQTYAHIHTHTYTYLTGSSASGSHSER